MGVDIRRYFFGRIAAMAAFATGAAKLFSQQAPAGTAPAPAAAGGPGQDAPRRPGGGEHPSHEGLYYLSGTGSNDRYPEQDRVLVSDPSESTSGHDGSDQEVSRAGRLHPG